MKILNKIIYFLRRWGICKLGYINVSFFSGYHCIYVFKPFQKAKNELYDWGPRVSYSDMEEALKPLPIGSSEAYHRIQFLAKKLNK